MYAAHKVVQYDVSIEILYEVRPKSIRLAFISSRQSARAASAGYERNQ